MPGGEDPRPTIDGRRPDTPAGDRHEDRAVVALPQRQWGSSSGTSWPPAAGTAAIAIRGSVRPDVQRHIFGTEAHGLAPLVTELGGERAVITEVARSLAQLPAAGFADGEIVQTEVAVAGVEVSVRGRKVDGVVRVATAFVHQ